MGCRGDLRLRVHGRLPSKRSAIREVRESPGAAAHTVHSGGFSSGGTDGQDERRGRKNERMSSTSAAGSSIAAKWPPAGIRVHCCTLKTRSAHFLGGLISSFGKIAQPVGTSTRIPVGGNLSAWMVS